LTFAENDLRLNWEHYRQRFGKDIEESGGKVAYVTIRGIRPKALSRIESIELQVA
jgi:hypothetical protein